jgi:hypothetical protein
MSRIQNGFCSTEIQFDTSKNGLKHVYTSPQEIYLKTYFLEIVHLKIIYNFYKKSFCLKEMQYFKKTFY